MKFGYHFESGFFDVRLILLYYGLLLLQFVLSLRKNRREGLVLPAVAFIYAVLLFREFKAHYPNYQANLYFLGVCQFFPVSFYIEYLLTRVFRRELVAAYQRELANHGED